MQSFFSYKATNLHPDLQPHDIPDIENTPGGDTRIAVVPNNNPTAEKFTAEDIEACDYSVNRRLLSFRIATRKAPARVVAKAFDKAAQVYLNEMPLEDRMSLAKFRRTKYGREMKRDITGNLDSEAEVTYEIIQVQLAYLGDNNSAIYILTHKEKVADSIIAYFQLNAPEGEALEAEFMLPEITSTNASDLFKSLILPDFRDDTETVAAGPMAWNGFKAKGLEVPYRAETRAALREHVELTLCGYVAGDIVGQYNMTTGAQGVDLGKITDPQEVYDKLHNATVALNKLIAGTDFELLNTIVLAAEEAIEV